MNNKANFTQTFIKVTRDNPPTVDMLSELPLPVGKSFTVERREVRSWTLSQLQTTRGRLLTPHVLQELTRSTKMTSSLLSVLMACPRNSNPHTSLRMVNRLMDSLVVTVALNWVLMSGYLTSQYPSWVYSTRRAG